MLQVSYPLARPQFALAKSLTCTVDRHLNRPVPGPTQLSQGESNFGDSSGPLFTLYSEIAEEEDNKMAERWQKDAEGIIIFVRPEVPFHTTAY